MTFGVIAGELGRRGHTVTVYRPRRRDLPSAPSPHFREVPLPGMPIPATTSCVWAAGGPGPAPPMDPDRPDLVHVATEGPLGASAVTAARRLGVPVTSSFHTNFHAYARHYGIGPIQRLALAWLRRVHKPHAPHVLRPRSKLCAELQARGFRELALLSRGIDTRQFRPEKAGARVAPRLGRRPDDPVVLHVGRMAPEKNYPLIFRAFAAMRAADPACAACWRAKVRCGPGWSANTPRRPSSASAAGRTGPPLRLGGHLHSREPDRNLWQCSDRGDGERPGGGRI